MTQIKDLGTEKIVPEGTDLIVIQEADGTTRRIKRSNFLSGLSSGATPPTNIFTYQSNGDTNGLLYYLGNLSGSWINPIAGGVVSFNTIGLVSGSDSVSVLADRQLNNPGIVTNNVSNSWIAWDIGVERRFTYTGLLYRQRNSVSYPGTYPRNWKLQGSNFLNSIAERDINNAGWVDLDIRQNNTQINNEGDWAYFAINPSFPYRFARLIGTGSNSSGSNGWALSDLEFYGQLF
jgi:hypothetical protein